MLNYDKIDDIIITDNKNFIILKKGKVYTLNGKRHRLDGPALIWSDLSRIWYINGKRHREDGPAIEHNGDKYWYIDDKRHREDGPAVEINNFGKSKLWYLNNKGYSEKDFLYQIKYKENYNYNL